MRCTTSVRVCMQIVHLIRHGQGFHNVAGEAQYELYKSWDYEDAHLTERGWQQVGRVQPCLTLSLSRLAMSPAMVEELQMPAKGALQRGLLQSACTMFPCAAHCRNLGTVFIGTVPRVAHSSCLFCRQVT